MISDIVLPKIDCVETSDTYGKFVAEPLERGIGITIGNALRRVLLNSIPGAAVTWVKIDGVEHEFSTIPYMKEDAIEFLLNVKEIRLRPLVERPGTIYLDVEGEGRISAGDINPSAEFEVVNPELHLATLDSPEGRLICEFRVELGKGFRVAARTDGLSIGVIPVGAIFTPTKRVNYSIEPTGIGLEPSYERLIMEVWTDGTISPMMAVSEGAEILIEQLSLFRDLAKAPAEGALEEPRHLLIPAEQYNMPIEKVGLSVRTLNCLRRGNISTVGGLVEKSEAELLEIRNLGYKSLEEIHDVLKVLDIEFPRGEE